jgi:hypothetical protein
MYAVPTFMISLYQAGQAYYITRRMMQCYYEPASFSAGGMDDEIVRMLSSVGDLEGFQG